MIIRNLRLLARQYFIGQIDRDRYLQERRQLIDDIVSGEVLLDEGDDITQTMTAVTETAPARSMQTPGSDSQTTVAPPAKDNTLLIISGIVIVALILVAAASTYLLSDDEPAQPAVASIAPVVQPTSPPPQLLETLLTSNDWSASTLQETADAWLNLEPDERAHLSNAPAYRQMEDAIHRQIQEARALMDIGDTEESVQNRQALLNFIQTMGSSDPRIELAQDVLQQDLDNLEAAPEETTDELPVPPVLAQPAETANNLTTLTEELLETESVIPDPPSEATVETAVAAGHTSPQAPLEETINQVSSEIATKPAVQIDAVSSPAPEEEAQPLAETSPEKVKAVGENTNQKINRQKGCREALVRSRKPFCRDALSEKVKGPVMVVLKGGQFTMGGERKHEAPQHDVNIAYNFALSMHEISYREFALFCRQSKRDCPAQPWSGEDYPVVNVSWHDALAYARWLSKYSGQSYRLPTEAEWEYAARSGTKGNYPTGDEILPTYARFSYNAGLDSPLPKSDRSVNRNKFRLYHMLGNVQEWVMDDWQDSYNGSPSDGSAYISAQDQDKVVRGGSYADVADNLRSAARRPAPASKADSQTGFRVALQFSAIQNTTGPYPLNQQWLSQQAAQRFTLQLFAVKNISNVQKLLDQHPDIGMKIVPVNDERFDYRVLYGAFDTEDQATKAFADLPLQISGQAGKAVVKTFAELQ